MEIHSFAEMKNALTKRMEFLMRWDAAHRIMDWTMPCMCLLPRKKSEAIFEKGMAGEPISKEEELKYKTAFMPLCRKRISSSGMGNAASLRM